MAGATISYNTLLDVQQVIRYNIPTTDSNGNAAYYVCAIFTNIKTQGSDGSVRDTQTISPVGTVQDTAFTPQQIYTTVNSASAGGILAAQLRAAYNEAVATVVS
jgi:hypothetical protein